MTQPAPKRPFMIGRRFGQLVVIELTARPEGYSTNVMRWWKCACDCGGICFIPTNKLTAGLRTRCPDRAAHPPAKPNDDGGLAALRAARARSAQSQQASVAP